MILIFGPQGSGKGTQAEKLAARNGWKWLSTGSMLRDTKDPEIQKVLNSGELIGDELMAKMLLEAFAGIDEGTQIILDGYPRNLSQAQWLLETLQQRHQTIDCIIVLQVPQSELMDRFRSRGRADDTNAAIQRRLQIYETATRPIIAFYANKRIPVAEVDGMGNIDEIHNRVVDAVEKCVQK